VVQEALNNCAQHAQASAVQVDLLYEDGRIRVTVQDDGSGFAPERVRGMGLLGMEERVRHLGGSFQIESQPGRGTLVSVMLPRRDIAEILWDGGLAYGANTHSVG
jgi:signal transduction histidine kinase